MATLRSERPPEFTDDVRLYKIFNKKSAITTLVSLLLAVVIYIFFNWIHLGIVGIIIGFFLVITTFLIFTLPVPDGDILHGSRLTLDIVLFNSIVRRKRQCIYIKHVDTKNKVD
jgi:hypothetical protein